MVTANDIVESTRRFLDDSYDVVVTRCTGGFANICGYNLLVMTEHDSWQTFFHDDNTVVSLKSKLVPFIETIEA